MRIEYLEKEFVIGRGNSFNKIPKEIEVDEEFCECFGLYYGDGQNKTGTNEFAFSNTDFNLTKKIIEWFVKYLCVDKSDFKLYIYLPRDLTAQNIENNIAKKLYIPVSCVKNIYVNEKSTKVCLLLMVKNAPMKYLFEKISEDLENIIKYDKSLIAAFIRGYLAAEGNVYTPRTQKICKITIGFGDINEFNRIKRFLDFLGIEYTTSHNRNKLRTKIYPKIEIHKRESVFRLYQYGGFGFNIERQKQFEKAITLLK